MSTDLERLYQDAKAALAEKNYGNAADLFRQVLKVDVDYKDAAQLLARVIKLSRRRWYNDPRLWGALGVLLLIGLGIYFFPRLQDLTSQPAPAPIALQTDTPAPTIAPPVTVTKTATPLPTPTSIPLTWKRIFIGQEFEHDTVTAFATDKNDPDVIYVGMKNSGVYKTIDGGLSWQPAHQGLSNTQVESLFIDSQNPRILYASTIGGIFTTDDGTENWFRISDGTHLLMDPQDSSHLYARDENSIYETTDQGNFWTTVYALKKDCPNEINSWTIHPKDGGMLFIGGGETCAGVYQSNDGGVNWKSIGMNDKPILDAVAIGLNEQEIYSIFARFPGTPGFMWDTYGWYASHDGGASWSIENGPSCDGILTSDPENPSLLYCGDASNLYIFRGKGYKWQTIPGTQSRVYTAIYIDHPNGTNRIIVGANDVSKASDPNVGIFISEDGGMSWTQQDNGLGLTRAELKVDPLDNTRIYLATYFSDVNAECRLYRSLDSGKSWSLIKWRGGDWCGPVFDATHVLYLKEKGALQESFDGGDTWLWEERGQKSGDRYNFESTKHALPSYYEGDSQSISANPFVQGYLYDVGNVIYHSKNTGASWQLSTGSEGLWDARLFYKDQGQTVYAIGRYHQSYSTDSGVTWQSCGEDITTSRSDTRLALDLQDSHMYLATPGQGVLVSTDECHSWQPSNDGLNSLFVNTLAIDPNNSNTIYAGTDGGVFISFDGGQTWGQVNDGLLGATVVYSIAIDSASNVYAATPYGIFKLEGK